MLKEEFGTEVTIQLQINNTLEKNGTVIRCVNTGMSNTIAETILIVDGKPYVLLYCIIIKSLNPLHNRAESSEFACGRCPFANC